MVLHRPSRLREVKWAASVLFPWLRGRDIAIFLYPSTEADFLANFDDIDTVQSVKFFLACREDDGFRTVPATAARFTRNSSRDEEQSSRHFIGLTIPIQDRPAPHIVASYMPVFREPAN